MEITLKPRLVTALCAPHAGRDEAALLTARLAVGRAVTVLDCGNRFNGYRLMQHLRLLLPDPSEAIRRVFVRRAFTCHQVATLLGETPPRPEPCIILDLLATFHDENVPLPEASRLLEECLRQVERLAMTAPLLITFPPPRPNDRMCFVERLEAAVEALYTVELPASPSPQPALF